MTDTAKYAGVYFSVRKGLLPTQIVKAVGNDDCTRNHVAILALLTTERKTDCSRGT